MASPSYSFHDLEVIVHQRRASTSSSSIYSSGSSSYSVSPPQTPPCSPPLPPQPTTLAELFRGLWSPEFAAKYIDNWPYCYYGSNPPVDAVTHTISFAPSELPNQQNSYCVSNYTLEKVALHQIKHGYDVQVLNALTSQVPMHLKSGLCARLQARIMKLVEKRRRLPLCGFCRNNGKSPQVYLSHTARDQQGRVSCPTLYKYHCPRCGASGDNAHTLSYCPLNSTSQ